MNKSEAIQTLEKCKRILEAVDERLMKQDIQTLEQVMAFIKEGSEQVEKRHTSKKANFDGKRFLQDVQENLSSNELLEKYELNLPTEYLKGSGNIVTLWRELSKTARNKFRIPELQSIYILLNKSATYKKSWTKKKLVEEIDSSVASWLRSERLTKERP
ncbi:hypothetical protein [Sutcliffiella cohnii]|uniref:Uncharacterized protein n=1 Tax=Sutcliffiella cohnii TaxID=33932 RepID=A0A223KNZ3_9BACI|nr:hypothetical protein [Sutcliffiella cohnii]AST91107.1 hypothetical protein BC6307_07355 [Sutcliffiella cohnii]MED4019023.1 hypothetical protein [Sutcliffiella cohnii]